MIIVFENQTTKIFDFWFSIPEKNNQKIFKRDRLLGQDLLFVQSH